MSEKTETGSDAGDDAVTARESPGRILKTGREKKGLSIEKLAAETLLSEDILTALEADDFERLSQPVFVRGYYRKCAKILDLSEKDLLAAYAAHAGAPGPLPVSPGELSVIPQDVTPRSWRTSGLMLAVLAVLLALAAVWWLMSGPNGSYAADNDVSDDAGSVIPAMPDDVGAPADTPANTPARAPGGETPAPAAEEGATAPDTPLRLQFNERSWVEVRDAAGKRLLEGIPPAGSERTVRGRIPYDVRLGNAPAVEILLDGERVVFEDRIRDDNTVRLTLAGDAAE